MSIFRKNSLERLKSTLKRVNTKDIHDYFRFERMKQGYYYPQKQPRDDLYYFFSNLTGSSKGIHETALGYFERVEQEARGQGLPGRADVKPIVRTKIYSKYSQLVRSMVEIAGVYDFFHEGKVVNSERGSGSLNYRYIDNTISLINRVLKDYPMGKRDVIKEIKNYCTIASSDNKQQLLNSLIFMIKRIALDTKNYVENCTKPLLLKFRRKYAPVYSNLMKIDMSEKEWPEPSDKNRMTDEKYKDAVEKLTQLIGMLKEEPKVGNADAIEKSISGLMVKLADYYQG